MDADTTHKTMAAQPHHHDDLQVVRDDAHHAAHHDRGDEHEHRGESHVHGEDHHRDVRSGSARAAVFGISDGLVSNVSLVLAIAGAGAATSTVRLAGLAGLLAGAISMAAGEYVSMRAQTELLRRELTLERHEIVYNADAEKHELEFILRKKGIRPRLAAELVEDIHRDPEIALQAHAKEELGIDPEELGSATGAAAASFVAFGIGAFVPLLPWFFAAGSAAVITTIALGATTAFGVGLALAYFTSHSYLRSALRQLGIAVVAGAVTYGLGSLVGTGV
jgi:VIT1/CCC1 family predicted Fe2+/Mn2+ transporter